jgi:preprotein translocase subunit SecD
MKSINQLRILIILGTLILSIIAIVKLPITLGLDLQGGTRLVFEGLSTDKVKVSDDSMTGLLGVIRNRVDALGVSEPTIIRKGNNQIVVELPGIKDPDRAIAIIGDTAVLEFAEAEWAPTGSEKLTQDKIVKIYGSNARMKEYEINRGGSTKTKYSIILKNTVLSGSDLKDVFQGIDDKGRLAIDLEFSSTGASLFAQATERSVGRPIAILLDNKIISAPTVNGPIPNGKAQITGDFTPDEVRDLVVKLKAGALPLPVRLIETKIVGPQLGKDSIDKSKLAGIFGFVLVAAFMFLYYRVPGLIADIALAIYVFLVLGLFALVRISGFGVTLSLPGIAGFLLSIGMAVDANVIIFERLKEELRSGKTLKAAIDASYERAWAAIMDSNVTTMLAAATLIFVGTGILKGFAITLIIGIVASMFTAITMTRMMLYMLVDTHIMSTPNKKLVYH